MSVQENFNNRIKDAMGKMQTLEDLRKADPMINYIFQVGKILFARDVSNMPEHELMKIGGKLAGIMPYLATKSSETRAGRDIVEQKFKETMREQMLTHIESGEKVTSARAMAEVDVGEIEEYVSFANHNKNNYENILDACKTMLLFIQTVLSTKRNERFIKGDMYNNA